MAKRVYENSIKKWLVDHKIITIGTGATGTLIGGIFLYLAMIGAITIHGYSGDMVCAGTIEDPCYAYINFTANEDIFIYPTNYDPWGRNTPFNFDPNVKSWRLERSWGEGWRNIPLDKSCTGTWCGLSNSKDTRIFSIAFREGRTYNVRVVAFKNNPGDEIKWGAFDTIDPIWLPVGYSLVYDCKNVTFDRVIYAEKEVLIKCPINEGDYSINKSNCTDHYENETYSYIELYDKIICEEIGVELNKETIYYEQKDLNCLRTDDTLCCFDKRDGGIYIESRAPQFRKIIRLGESGTCINLSNNLKTIDVKSDFGEIKISAVITK